MRSPLPRQPNPDITDARLEEQIDINTITQTVRIEVFCMARSCHASWVAKVSAELCEDAADSAATSAMRVLDKLTDKAIDHAEFGHRVLPEVTIGRSIATALRPSIDNLTEAVRMIGRVCR